MKLLRPASPNQIDIALTVLRVITGVIFMAHGGQKLFVFGFAGVSAAFGQMGLPMPALFGPFITFLEFFGGMALIVGLFTRLASLGLAFNMLGAILVVHLKNGFFLPTGAEFALALLGPSIALFFTGAGRWSLDGRVINGRELTAETRHPSTSATTKRAA